MDANREGQPLTYFRTPRGGLKLTRESCNRLALLTRDADDAKLRALPALQKLGHAFRRMDSGGRPGTRRTSRSSGSSGSDSEGEHEPPIGGLHLHRAAA